MFVLVTGSKGGVGTTMLTLALAQLSTLPVRLVDISGTLDLSQAAGRRAVLLDEMARLPDYRLGQAVQLAQPQDVLTLSETGRLLYAQRAARILDLLEAQAVMVVDAGAAPLPAVVELASAVVLIVTPDPRSRLRAERFTRHNAAMRDRLAAVLNFARAGESVQDVVVALPDVGRADPLRSEAWCAGARALALRLGLASQAQPAGPEATPGKRGRPAFDFRRLAPIIRLVD